MVKVIIIGGTGGLGKKVTTNLSTVYEQGMTHNTYQVFSLSSKDLDIRNFESCKKYFEIVQPDVIINLSGVNHDKFIHKLGQEDQYLINYLLDVNLHGTINILSAALPGMRERGYGRIILMSSVLATKNVMGTGLYSSCKAFIDRLTKSASIENIGKGITVNSIQLGYFDGGLTDKLNNKDKFQQEIPLKRWGQIDELCSTIEYLINTEYTTGVNLPVTGGL